MKTFQRVVLFRCALLMLLLPLCSGIVSVFAQGTTPLSYFPTFNGGINAIAVDGNIIYVGGSFMQATNSASNGGITLTRNRLAAIDGTTGALLPWNPGADNDVSSLAVNASTVYVGGGFSMVGGQARNRIAAVNASGGVTAWNPNANQQVNTLAVGNGVLYVGGFFTNIGGQARSRIAALDFGTGNATTWNPNSSSAVTQIIPNGGTVYAVGLFANIGGQTRTGLAELDASTGLAGALNVNSMGANFGAVDAANIYLGGFFSSFGGNPRSRIGSISKASGAVTSWNPSATPGMVMSIAPIGSMIYVGGSFTTIGGQPRSRLAGLDVVTGLATAWNPNVVGVSVNQIVPFGNSLLVGGTFATVGGQARANFAVFSLAPNAITSFSPATGGAGTMVVIRGSGFLGASDVTIGGIPVASFTVDNNNQITAVLGAGVPGSGGPQLVVVQIPGGTLSLSGFMYGSPNSPGGTPPIVPLPLPIMVYSIQPSQFTFGTQVTIRGTGFTGAQGLIIGGKLVRDFTVIDDNTATAVVGTVPTDDRIRLTGVSSLFVTFSGIGVEYIYPPAPVIASTTPSPLEASGDDASVILSGANFLAGASAFVQEGVISNNADFLNVQRTGVSLNVQGSSGPAATASLIFPGFLRSPGIKTITLINPDGQYASAQITVTRSSRPIQVFNAQNGSKQITIQVGATSTTVSLRGSNIFRTAIAELRRYGKSSSNSSVRGMLYSSIQLPMQVTNSSGASVDFITEYFLRTSYDIVNLANDYSENFLYITNNDGQFDSLKVNFIPLPRPMITGVSLQQTSRGRLLTVRGKNFVSPLELGLGLQFSPGYFGRKIETDSVRGDSVITMLVPDWFTGGGYVHGTGVDVSNPDRQYAYYKLPTTFFSTPPPSTQSTFGIHSGEADVYGGATNQTLPMTLTERLESLGNKAKLSPDATPWSIAPNPVESYVNITLGDNDDISFIRVLDMRGSIVSQSMNSAPALYLGSLPVGIYIVEVRTVGVQILRKRIIKQ